MDEQFQNHPNFYDYDELGVPDEMYYGIFDKKKREEFEEMKSKLPAGYRFNNAREIVNYCRLD